LKQEKFAEGLKLWRITSVRHLTLFDYAICAVGLLGTIATLGILGHLPNLLLVLTTVISGIICMFSLGLLLDNFWRHSLKPIDKRLHALHFFMNLPPTIYLLVHLRETPWDRFIT